MSEEDEGEDEAVVCRKEAQSAVLSPLNDAANSETSLGYS